MNLHSVTLTEVKKLSSLGNSTIIYVISKSLDIFGQFSIWDFKALKVILFFINRAYNMINPESYPAIIKHFQSSKSVEIEVLTYISEVTVRAGQEKCRFCNIIQWERKSNRL